MDNIKVLYEDENLIFINKPSGLAVHADGQREEETVVSWMEKYYPSAKTVGEPLKLSNGSVIERAGIVHRLDKETSGVLVLAKNQDTFLFLKEQFQHRQTKKTYHAFVYGVLKNNSGLIDKPIGRNARDFRKWTAEGNSRGEERAAQTEYVVLTADEDKKVSLLEVKPLTGRTHQIRVHLKAIGHPVIADKLYAPNRETKLGFQRLALHAFSLVLKAPDGKVLDISAPHPEDFTAAAKETGYLLE